QCYSNMSTLYQKIGEPAQAQAALETAQAIAESLVRDEPEQPAYQRQLAEVFERFGLVYRSSGRAAEAEGVLKQALALCQELDRKHPNIPVFRAEVAHTSNLLGDLY